MLCPQSVGLDRGIQEFGAFAALAAQEVLDQLALGAVRDREREAPLCLVAAVFLGHAVHPRPYRRAGPRSAPNPMIAGNG